LDSGDFSDACRQFSVEGVGGDEPRFHGDYITIEPWGGAKIGQIGDQYRSCTRKERDQIVRCEPTARVRKSLI
jgi:hypothetical protein